jgi:hypothetical protein
LVDTNMSAAFDAAQIAHPDSQTVKPGSSPTLTCRVVLVMELPPPAGYEAAGTVECGNATVEGEQPPKQAKNGRFSENSALNRWA